MWAEFYNLGRGKGITFPINQVSLCGHTLRIELLPRPLGEGDEPKVEECWHFVRVSEDFDFIVDGRKWLDFGVSKGRFEEFTVVEPWGLRGLVQQ